MAAGGGGGSGGSNTGISGADGNCPDCEWRDPDSTETAQIDSVRPYILCPDGQAAFDYLSNDNRIVVYSKDNGYSGNFSHEADFMFISLKHNWPNGQLNFAELIDTVIHEITHRLLGPQYDNHGGVFDTRASQCKYGGY